MPSGDLRRYHCDEIAKTFFLSHLFISRIPFHILATKHLYLLVHLYHSLQLVFICCCITYFQMSHPVKGTRGQAALLDLWNAIYHQYIFMKAKAILDILSREDKCKLQNTIELIDHCTVWHVRCSTWILHANIESHFFTKLSSQIRTAVIFTENFDMQ